MFGPTLTSWDTARWYFACLMAVNLLAVPSKAEPQVDATSHARVGDGPLHAYVAAVSLPADGLWRIRVPESTNSIRELYLMPTQPSRRNIGDRAEFQWREALASTATVSAFSTLVLMLPLCRKYSAPLSYERGLRASAGASVVSC